MKHARNGPPLPQPPCWPTRPVDPGSGLTSRCRPDKTPISQAQAESCRRHEFYRIACRSESKDIPSFAGARSERRARRPPSSRTAAHQPPVTARPHARDRSHPAGPCRVGVRGDGLGAGPGPGAAAIRRQHAAQPPRDLGFGYVFDEPRLSIDSETTTSSWCRPAAPEVIVTPTKNHHGATGPHVTPGDNDGTGRYTVDLSPGSNIVPHLAECRARPLQALLTEHLPGRLLADCHAALGRAAEQPQADRWRRRRWSSCRGRKSRARIAGCATYYRMVVPKKGLAAGGCSRRCGPVRGSRRNSAPEAGGSGATRNVSLREGRNELIVLVYRTGKRSGPCPGGVPADDHSRRQSAEDKRGDR